MALLLSALILLVSGYWLISLPVIALALAVAFFFRDMPRKIPPKPLAIISPLDGTVVSVEKTHDPYIERDAVCIVAKTHAFGPFVLRSPIEGKIQNQWFSPVYKNRDGKRQASELAMCIRTDEDDIISAAFTPNFFWSRILCRVQAGERIGQGRRCGFIPFGATIEVFLPESTRLKVEPGDKITAGDTILAELIRK